MSKLQKNNTLQVSSRSSWEEIWREKDFVEHEGDFQQILSEDKSLREIYKNGIVARWRWLEKKKAITIEMIGNHIEPIVIGDYAMYDAMFSKFCMWLAFREKRGIFIWPENKPNLLNIHTEKNDMAKQMTIKPIELGEIHADDILKSW